MLPYVIFKVESHQNYRSSKGLTDKEIEYKKLSDFYRAKQDDGDAISYLLRKEANGNNLTNEEQKQLDSYLEDGGYENDFLGYAKNRRGSTGSFNSKNKELSIQDVSKLREDLRKTNSIVWTGLISFEEIYGKTNCKSKEDAMRMIKKVMPKFYEKMGLDPNNIEDFFAFHTNTDNPHLHFIFFEKEKTFIDHKGNLKYRDYYIKNLAVIKDETRVDILNHFGLEKTAFNVMDETKFAFSQNLHKGIHGHQFEQLVNKLKGNRIKQFARLSKDKKEAIKVFYNHLLKNDREIKGLYQHFKRELEKTQIRMAKHLESKDIDKENTNLEREKRNVNNFVKTRLNDFELRMCNLILKEAINTKYKKQKPLLEVFNQLKKDKIIPQGMKKPTRKIENRYLSTEKQNKHINNRRTSNAVFAFKQGTRDIVRAFTYEIKDYYYDFTKEPLDKESLQYLEIDKNINRQE